jgi:hypothetical protein
MSGDISHRYTIKLDDSLKMVSLQTLLTFEIGDMPIRWAVA